MRTTGEATAAQPDYTNAPASYDEFHRLYRRYVEGLCWRLGIEQGSVEDVASEILIRLYERDILSMYDPATKIEHRGTAYQPRFKSFLTAQVQAYVKGKRQRQTQLAQREPLICDKPVGETGASWVEIFGPSYSDDHSTVEEHELVIRIRTHLAGVPRRSDQDRCDLLALFDACVDMARTEGKINIKDLQATFGVSSTAIWSWLSMMRTSCRPVLDRHMALA